MRDEVAVVLLALAALAFAVTAALLLPGCAVAPPRPRMLADEAHVIGETVRVWRDARLPWPASCERAFRAVQVDPDIGRCCAGQSRACVAPHACTLVGRDWVAIHIEPGYGPSLLVHEALHALHRCAGLAGSGDHSSPLWRTPGVSPHADKTLEAAAVRAVVPLAAGGAQ